MADNKSIELTVSGGGHKSSDHDHKSNQPANSNRRQVLGAQCLLVVAVILLALTAQVFRKDVFAEPHFGNNAVDLSLNCTAEPVIPCQTYITTISGCVSIPADDGLDCGAAGAGFKCWQGKCVSSTDAANAVFCNNPPDTRCAASIAGIYQDGKCHYTSVPDFTRCHPTFGDNDTVLLGWSCQQGVCTSPVKQLIGNNAYQWSINAGLIAAAVAIEVLFTGSFTPELVFLAINAGLILIGFDGKLQDLNLEFNSGIGRTQVAFGFIVGSLAVYYGFRLLQKSPRNPAGTPDVAFAVILIFFHGVTVGLVSHLWENAFNTHGNGSFQTYENISYNWAYPASIYAAMVALAVSFSVLLNGKPTNGFGAYTFATGVVELAWASSNVDEDTVFGDFTGTANAWHSFAIISSVFSIIFGLAWTFNKKNASVDEGVQNKANNRGFALVSVLVFWTMIGIVASLYQNAFLDSDAATVGTNPRFVDFVDSDNFLNQVSSFAWEHSIWTGVVVSSFALESLIFGSASNGIVALSIVKAANLVGWAAEHNYVGSITGKQELDSRTRAWEALSLVAGIIAFIAAVQVIKASKSDDGSAKAQDDHHNSIDAADRDQFVTKGQP